MNGCWDQLLWLGDVVADQDYVFRISGDAADDQPLLVPKGAWFANPLVFWAWALDQVGDTWPSLIVTFPTSGQMTLTLGGGEWYAEQTSGSMLEELHGLGPRDQQDPSTSLAVFAPSWPAMVLDVGTLFHNGHSHRAHTGRAYSIPAIAQRSRDVQVQFDYLDLEEYEQWRNLWDWRFTRGRSCTLFHGKLPTQIGLTLDDLGAMDQLMAEPSVAAWRGQRTAEYRNVIAHDEEAINYRRRPNIPLSEGPDIQTYYIPPARSF